jgi:two-component system cell cycle sensor histidine kinase/response regulator CckA
VLTIINDVTAERAALSELKKLSSAVEQTADAVFITDQTGAIEYVNPAFEAITGFTRAEALGKTPRILKSGQMPPEYYERL